MKNILPPKTITFEVKSRHIKNGVKRDCYKCPIAQAIAEKYTPYYTVEVGACGVYLVVNSNNKSYFYPHSVKTGKLIRNFDEGITIKVGIFKLKIDHDFSYR